MEVHKSVGNSYCRCQNDRFTCFYAPCIESNSDKLLLVFEWLNPYKSLWCWVHAGCKAEGKCSVGKPLIVRPVRGGSDRICELGFCQEVQILDKCDSTQIKWYWWSSLASKLMQNASSLLKRYGFYTSLQRCCARWEMQHILVDVAFFLGHK